MNINTKSHKIKRTMNNKKYLYRNNKQNKNINNNNNNKNNK